MTGKPGEEPAHAPPRARESRRIRSAVRVAQPPRELAPLVAAIPTDHGESATATLTTRSTAAFSPRATPYPSTISKSLPGERLTASNQIRMLPRTRNSQWFPQLEMLPMPWPLLLSGMV